jgi:amidase/aspartyl-tRNA(Asn)/glutamyl-tRNA(Gln) amidotransferase subunit A
VALSDELAYVPAHELAARIRRRDLSPVEVVDAAIARIEARNPSPNVLVRLGRQLYRSTGRCTAVG